MFPFVHKQLWLWVLRSLRWEIFSQKGIQNTTKCLWWFWSSNTRLQAHYRHCQPLSHVDWHLFRNSGIYTSFVSIIPTYTDIYLLIQIILTYTCNTYIYCHISGNTNNTYWYLHLPVNTLRYMLIHVNTYHPDLETAISLQPMIRLTWAKEQY
jgi:hypothetical protein